MVLGTAEDKSLSRIAKNMELVRLADQNEIRIAVQSGRAQALFDDISGNAKFAKENKTYPADHPRQPDPGRGNRLRDPSRATRTTTSRPSTSWSKNYINTAKLKAAEAKYGLPNPERLHEVGLIHGQVAKSGQWAGIGPSGRSARLPPRIDRRRRIQRAPARESDGGCLDVLRLGLERRSARASRPSSRGSG